MNMDAKSGFGRKAIFLASVCAMSFGATQAQQITATRNLSPELAKALLQDAASVNRLTAEGKLLHESNPNPRSWGQYCGSAWLLNDQGELRKAIQAASMALFVGSTDVNREMAYAFAKRDLAISYSYSGNLEMAQKYATESISHNAGSQYQDIWSVSYKTLGDVASRKGEHVKAIEHYRKAESYSSVGWRRLVRISLANAYFHARQDDNASAMLKEISTYGQSPLKEMVARLGAEMALRAGRVDEAVTKFREYGSAAEKEDGDYHRVWALDGEARALAAKGDKRGALIAFQDATAAAEKVRARFRSEEFKTGMFGEMDAVFARTIAALGDAGETDRAFQVAEAARARALADQIRGRVQGASALAATPTISPAIGGVQAILGASDVAIAYYVTEDQTFAWLISPKDASITKLAVKRDDLRAAIQRFRAAIVERAPDIKDHAGRLHNILIKPLNIKSGSNVIVIPHDALHHVPFQALWSGDQFLLAAGSISYAPSAAVLLHIAKTRNASRPRQLIAFGNPDLGNQSLALPGAEREVENIKAIFPGAVTFVGAEASKPRFIAEAPRYTMIHVAAHAEFDDVDPLYSRVRLASEKNQSGFLEARDIYGLNFRSATLITLSACESGMSRITRGDEIWGFSRSFLTAGAPALVLSLWPVADQSTEKLMTTFYRELVTVEPRAALRQAQLEVSRMKEYEHPFFWAAFNLTGDWR